MNGGDFAVKNINRRAGETTHWMEMLGDLGPNEMCVRSLPVFKEPWNATQLLGLTNQPPKTE